MKDAGGYKLNDIGYYWTRGHRDDWEIKAHYMQYKQSAQQAIDELLKQYEISID